jgi:NAD(P)H-dependent FMN reductase
MPFAVTILYGSYRRDRQGIRAVRFVEAQLKARGHTVTLLDAMALELPMLDRMYKEHPKGSAPPVLEKMAETIRASDGFVVVTGEYNQGVPPGLKNMLDHFLEEWFWRPSAIVSYSQGSFAGVRAAILLRITLAELGMPAISSTLPVPQVQKAFDEAGVPADPEAWARRSKKFLSEFDWHMAALKAQREKGVPY